MRMFGLSKAFFATSAAIAVFTAPASATHSWGGMHWSHTTTLTLRLGDNVDLAWDPYLVTASLDWTKAVPIDTQIKLGTRVPSTCSPTYGQVEVCNYRYGANGWLGIANVWTQYGHIVQGTVKLNDTYFASASYNTPAWRRTVMCQEIGHTFGLDHQDEDQTNLNLGSCMDYTRDPSGLKGTNGKLSNEHPNAHDYDELSTIYAHKDGSQLNATRASSSAFSGNVFAGSQGVATNPALAAEAPLALRDLGRVVARDGRGRGRVFQRALGGGAELITFITWAD